MNRKMRMEFVLAGVALACAPLAFAHKTAPYSMPYPNEKVAAFVVEKLDVTSLPSTYGPKKEKGKKTLADYGYTPQQLEDKQALVTAANGAQKLSIKILQEDATGIYACLADAVANGSDPKAPSVILLKRKDSNALLKGRVSWKEFASCPISWAVPGPVQQRLVAT